MLAAFDIFFRSPQQLPARGGPGRRCCPLSLAIFSNKKVVATVLTRAAAGHDRYSRSAGATMTLIREGTPLGATKPEAQGPLRLNQAGRRRKNIALSPAAKAFLSSATPPEEDPTLDMHFDPLLYAREMDTRARPMDALAITTFSKSRLQRSCPSPPPSHPRPP